jgi:hypothetical protein
MAEVFPALQAELQVKADKALVVVPVVAQVYLVTEAMAHLMVAVAVNRHEQEEPVALGLLVRFGAVTVDMAVVVPVAIAVAVAVADIQVVPVLQMVGAAELEAVAVAHLMAEPIRIIMKDLIPVMVQQPFFGLILLSSLKQQVFPQVLFSRWAPQ